MGKRVRYLPLRRNKHGVDWCHCRNIESDKPHWRSGESEESQRDQRHQNLGVLPSNAARHGLELPSVGITNAPGPPENNRGKDPRPKELPKERRPPSQHCKRSSTRSPKGTYHSHPLPCFMAISMGVSPWTSVPGMPNSGWNLREIIKMRTTTNSYPHISQRIPTSTTWSRQGRGEPT